MMTGWFVKSEL